MSQPRQALRREVLYLALAGMDTCFLLPIALAVSQFAARFPPLRAAPAFFVVVLLAFNLTRLLDALQLKESVQRDIGLAVLVLWLLLVLRATLYHDYPLLSLRWLGEMVRHLGDRQLWPQDATILVTTLVFWWRGLELAGRPLDVDSVGYHFRAGVLILAVAVGLVSQAMDWSPSPFVFAFFFLSLVAIALSRAEEVGQWRIGLPFPFSWGWLFSVALAASAVVVIAIGLISVFTGEDLIKTLALLGPVWDVLRNGLLIVLSAIFYLLYPLLAFVIARISALLGEGVELRPDAPFENPLLKPGDLVDRPSPFEPYGPILRALTIAAAVLIVALALGRLWRARQQLGEVKTESAWGEPVAGEGLAERARRRLRSLMGRLGFLSRWYAAASIRRIYAQLVALAGRRGYPRDASDTPFEYMPTLLEVWPSLEPQLRSITEAYVRVHYGEVPETVEEIQAIRDAWDQVRQA